MLLVCPHCGRQVDCTGHFGNVVCPHCSGQFVVQPQATVEPAVAMAVKKVTPRKRRSSNTPLILGGCAFVVVAILVVAIFLSQPPSKGDPRNSSEPRNVAAKPTYNPESPSQKRQVSQNQQDPVTSKRPNSTQTNSTPMVVQRKREIPLTPSECWLTGRVDGHKGKHDAGRDFIFLWIRCDPTDDAKTPGRQFELGTDDVVLIAPDGNAVEPMAMKLHSGGDPTKNIDGMSWAFRVSTSDVRKLPQFHIRFRQDEPLALNPTFRPFDLFAGKPPALRWPDVEATQTLGIENGKGLVIFTISFQGSPGFEVKMTGKNGERLLMDQAGSLPKIDFVWVEQPIEVCDPTGHVLFRTVAGKDKSTNQESRPSRDSTQLPKFVVGQSVKTTNPDLELFSPEAQEATYTSTGTDFEVAVNTIGFRRKGSSQAVFKVRGARGQPLKFRTSFNDTNQMLWMQQRYEVLDHENKVLFSSP